MSARLLPDDVKKINVSPGGKQQIMHDGWCGRNPFPMTTNGVPKGLCLVLEQSGVDTRKMSADQMRETLSSHYDFRDEMFRIERFKKKQYTAKISLWHCELNSIGDRVSDIRKPNGIQSLRKNIIPTMESAPHESI